MSVNEAVSLLVGSRTWLLSLNSTFFVPVFPVSRCFEILWHTCSRKELYHP